MARAVDIYQTTKYMALTKVNIYQITWQLQSKYLPNYMTGPTVNIYQITWQLLRIYLPNYVTGSIVNIYQNYMAVTK
jgi:hypothetical protein